MRWLLLGAVLALLLLYPSLLTVVAAVLAAALSKPVLMAFGLGLATPRLRRWLR